MRQNWLSNRIFKSFDDIVDHCCYAWNTLIDQPWKIMSISARMGNRASVVVRIGITHSPLERVDRALVLCQRQQADRGDRLGTANRLRFSHHSWRGRGRYGLAQVPEPIAAGPVKAGKLVHVLEPFAPMAPGVFLYYPSRHQMMPKLRAFIHYVKSRSGATNKTRSHIDDKRTRGMKMR
jgi:hypothetical protein